MIARKAEQFSHAFGQLRTPLTANKVCADIPYGLDNGCFSVFHRRAWLRLVAEAKLIKPLFVTLPDIVGDARRTLELFAHFEAYTIGLPRALVLQDGIGDFEIPWEKIDAVFVGGSDNFKTSPEAINACKTAKMMSKWVHVGRVNNAKRTQQFIHLADSIDGSGLSRFDHMLSDVLSIVDGKAHSLQFILPMNHDESNLSASAAMSGA